MGEEKEKKVFNANAEHWFYIRPNYRRELKVQEHFRALGVETYVPMHKVYKDVNGKPTKAEVPLLSNFVFVKTDYMTLRREKKTLEALGMPFMLRMDTMNRTHPIVIADKVMEDFIRICESGYSRSMEGVDMEKIKKGAYVEVTDGPWKGVQGYYARPWKDKCVVVLIEGVTAVCTTYIPPFALKVVEGK